MEDLQKLGEAVAEITAAVMAEHAADPVNVSRSRAMEFQRQDKVI